MLCIRNATLIDGVNPKANNIDIIIENGMIKKIGKDLEYTGIQFIDASGFWVMPGLIDAHCHLREPGFEYKEDIASGSRSAAIGGFTQIACMPNTNPILDNAPLVNFVQQRAKADAVVKVHVIGAITKGSNGKELTEMGELKDAGVVALSDDGKPVESSNMMKKALEYAKSFKLLLISHCEEVSLSENGVMNEGYYSTVLGLRGISRAAEEIMVARDSILAEATMMPIHIAHVSTRGSIDIIRKAKERGVKITCETAPHYFSATDKWVIGYDTNTKVNPPLRTEDDLSAIIEGLQDGTIDIIATDHAPHHRDEKEVEYDLAANGISGFETAFALGITNLVHPGYLTIEELIQKMAVMPAKILGITGGIIREGAQADILIADPSREITITTDTIVSKGKNSPFIGHTLKGKVLYTIVQGKIVVNNGILQGDDESR